MADDDPEPSDEDQDSEGVGTDPSLSLATDTVGQTRMIQMFRDVLSASWMPSSMSEERRNEKVAQIFKTLDEINPRDPFERMLSVQMLACHEAITECLRRSMIEQQTHVGREASLNQANKLMNTYTKLLDTLNKHRGKGQQKVTVEHVNVAAGGQAIVGTVETSAGPGAKPQVLENTPDLPLENLAPKDTKPVPRTKKKTRGDGRTS